MMHPPAVVAVDDTPSELEAIVRALRHLDVACLPVHAEGTTLNVAAPLSGISLIFFDINYLPGVTTQTVRFEVAATVFKKLISPENGPYILVTWTSKPDEHHALMRFFAEDVPEIPAPAMTTCLAKEMFIVGADDPGPAVKGGLSLREAIGEALKPHPQINALLEWELSARRAAGEVVSSILNLFSRTQRFGQNYGTQIEGLLSHMASCAVGSDNVALDRRAAINEAFGPVLFDRMIHGSAGPGEDELWAKALTLGRGLTPPTGSHMHRLNALGHIALRGSGAMSAGDRGVVFSLNPSAGQYMAGKAGRTAGQVASDFVGLWKKDENKASEPTPQDLESCRWVMVGLRAVCDQAHNHGALRPTVLGLEVPEAALADRGLCLRFRRHGAMFLTPVFEIEGNASFPAGGRAIIINWHWVTSLGPAELAGTTVLYRLREAAMNSLVSSVSGYTSRPGIISFTDKFEYG